MNQRLVGRTHCAVCNHPLRGCANLDLNASRFCSSSCALHWAVQAEMYFTWTTCPHCTRPVAEEWLGKLDDGTRVCPECHWAVRRVEWEREQEQKQETGG